MEHRNPSETLSLPLSPVWPRTPNYELLNTPHPTHLTIPHNYLLHVDQPNFYGIHATQLNPDRSCNATPTAPQLIHTLPGRGLNTTIGCRTRYQVPKQSGAATAVTLHETVVLQTEPEALDHTRQCGGFCSKV
jgi:hypothetical protein